MMAAFPAARASKPLWLITLADLALLLVGFLVLVNATTLDAAALARGLRAGFDAEPAALAVSAGAVDGFAPGSAALPGAIAPLAAWAREAARDPRVRLTVVGSVDGTRADRDPPTGSAVLLANDRARAVAAALIAADAVAPDRITLSPDPRGHRRRVVATLAFAGDPQ